MAPHPPPQDLRNVITADAFQVAPQLLGMPLARPSRRALAMAVDGLLIAVLSNAPGVLLAVAAAYVLFRASGRAGGGLGRRSFRLVSRSWGAAILFVAVLALWNSVAERLGEDAEAERAASSAAALEDGVALTGLSGVGAVADFIALRTADSEAEARGEARELVDAMRGAGIPDEEIGRTLREISRDATRPWLTAAVEAVLPSPAAAPEPSSAVPDSLAIAYAGALTAGDTTEVMALRTRLAPLLAADTLRVLNEAVQREARRQTLLRRRLAEAREEAENVGVLGFLRAFADDLGLGIGWAGLYFTGFVALWQGRTPGKRLMGVRVIRLDGAPAGWWTAFNRFGGYAAGIATGLLGFAQIYWDRNRQAVHDKIVETVVVRE